MGACRPPVVIFVEALGCRSDYCGRMVERAVGIQTRLRLSAHEMERERHHSIMYEIGRVVARSLSHLPEPLTEAEGRTIVALDIAFSSESLQSAHRVRSRDAVLSDFECPRIGRGY